MAGQIDPAVLSQHWVHSHEEDTESETVFRPSNFHFPPSRGRAAFELKPDGTLVKMGIAPVDGSIESRGTWRLEDDKLLFFLGDPKKPQQVMQILDARKDRLVVKK